MDSFKFHLQGIQITINTFVKGRFLWFFIPGVVITLVYLIIQYMAWLEYEEAQLSSDWSAVDEIFGWINTVTSWIYSLFSFLLEKVYVFFILTILSPFHAYMAEKFDSSMTGKKFPYSFGHFLRDFFRMLFVVTMALMMQFAFVLVWLILSFIPGLSVLDDVMFFLISAFFYGFAFHDYALERYRMSIGKSIQFAFRHPLTMIMTGGIFLGIYAVPYIGILFSSIFTTMISTVVFLRMHKAIDGTRTEINPKIAQ